MRRTKKAKTKIEWIKFRECGSCLMKKVFFKDESKDI